MRMKSEGGIILLVAIILTFGAIIGSILICQSDRRIPLRTEVTNNKDYQVELLFTNNGCTVYRFYDQHYVYYTTCEGTITSSHSEGSPKLRHEVQDQNSTCKLRK